MRHVVLLVVCAAAAWPSFWMPFRGDEACYLTTARETAFGEVLYRDNWDVTNPGIFWFYQVAGTLFGFTEDGVRLLEALWQTAFAFAVSIAAKRSYGLPRLPVLPGAVVVAVYYLAGYSNTNHLARVEGLIPFLFFLAVWCPTAAMTAGRRAWLWLLVGGLAGGLIPVFKLMFGGVAILAWLVLAVEFSRRRDGSKLGNLGLFSLFIGLGAVAPLAITCADFAAHDALGDYLWTTFEAPTLILNEAEPVSANRLVVLARWSTATLAGPTALALVAVACSLRHGRDPVTVSLVVLLMLSVPAILAQRLSWWTYHAMLPAGLLAALGGYGLPAISAMLRERLLGGESVRETLVLAAAFLFASAPLIAAGGYQWLVGAKHRFGLTTADRAIARASQGHAYEFAQSEADWLRQPERKSGCIFVAGDPLISFLADRRLGIGVPGWALEMWPAAIGRRMAEQVRDRRPAYVYVCRKEDDYETLIRRKYPELQAVLDTDYVVAKQDARGVWYEAK